MISLRVRNALPGERVQARILKRRWSAICGWNAYSRLNPHRVDQPVSISLCGAVTASFSLRRAVATETGDAGQGVAAGGCRAKSLAATDRADAPGVSA